MMADLSANEVFSITSHVSETAAEVTLVLTKRTEYRVFRMRSPDRVVVDFQNVKLADDLAISFSGEGILLRTRYAERGSNGLRLVLDTRELASFTHGFKHSEQPKQIKLVLNVGRDKIKSSTGKKDEKKLFTVAIDAGHGGEDSGAVGTAGTYEKDITLDIAVRLNNVIKQNSKVQGVLTREGDRRLKLRNRVEVAREKGADLFLSIHADAIRNRLVRGSSVYVLSNRGASSELARRLASQANVSDFIGSIRRENKDDDLWETLVDLSQKASSEESIKVAKGILKELNKVGEVHKKQVQHAGFMVLKSLDVPSVLIEVAFISNPYEEQRLNDPVFRQNIAEAIYRGICAYFEVPEKILGRNGFRKYIVRKGDTLSAIAVRHRITIEKLKALNKLISDAINEGQILLIP